MDDPGFVDLSSAVDGLASDDTDKHRESKAWLYCSPSQLSK